MNDRSLKRQIRKLADKNTGFKPYQISLTSMCNIAGESWYLNQIKRQLAQRMEETPSLMDHVYIDTDLDYLIDTTGAILIKDILIQFFDEKDLDDLLEYTVAKNNTARSEYAFDSLFKNQTTRKLLAMKRLYKTYPIEPEQADALQMVKEKIEQELNQRHPLIFKR